MKNFFRNAVGSVFALASVTLGASDPSFDPNAWGQWIFAGVAIVMQVIGWIKDRPRR